MNTSYSEIVMREKRIRRRKICIIIIVVCMICVFVCIDAHIGEDIFSLRYLYKTYIMQKEDSQESYHEGVL